MKMIILLSMLFCFATNAGTLEIMSYNVENLFDTSHDVVNGKDKEDYTFLPKSDPKKSGGCKAENSKSRRAECFDLDWTDEKLQIKLSQIKTAVEAERTQMPNILALVEVENKNVVQRLADKLGYKRVEITESPDERGVDVALIFNETKELKQISRNELVVELSHATRNILEAEFLVNGKYPLTIFVNHWPSLANPDSFRVKAAEVLIGRIKELQAKNKEMSFIAVGDFNTIPSNNPHPFDTVLLKDGVMLDLHHGFMNDASVSAEVKGALPKGSYFYPKNKEWNLLDHIFYSANLNDKKDLDLEISSYRIHAPKVVMREWTIGKHDDPKTFKPFFVPMSYKHEEMNLSKVGFSDHLALYASLKFPDAAKAPETKAVKIVKGKKKK